MPTEAHDQARRLRSEIDRLERLLRATNSVGSAGLPPARISVLLAVDLLGPARLAQIGQHQRLHPTMLSRIVGHLVDADLVTRSHDQRDRRSVWLATTERGHQLAERVRAERAELVRRALIELDEQHRSALRNSVPALSALADVLQAQPG